MAESVHCRRAVPEDGRAIATAHVLAWQHAYAGLIPDDYLSSLSIDESHERRKARLALIDPNLFVGELDGEVVGFCAIGPSVDPAAGPHVGKIEGINFHPRAWRRGVGRALLSLCADMLREHGYTEATLWVLEGNERARHFYAACGWKLDRRQSAHKVVTEIADVELPHLRYRLKFD
jgi:ribosomal protein S18 acetylase RimI-like enzyme